MKDFESQIYEISKLIDSRVEDLGLEIKENIILNKESSSYHLKESVIFSKIFSEIVELDLREDIFIDYLKNSLASHVNWAIESYSTSKYISFQINSNFVFEITNFSEEDIL